MTELTPNQMWAALVALCGYVPLPLTAADYLELLPVRWQPITERGIRIDYRTYDHDDLNPHRGQRSPVTAKDGRWEEVHHNPHDPRQIWVRLPDGKLHEIGWIHRAHVHQPFNDRIWRHIQSEVEQRGDRDQHEADLADALDQLLRRTRDTAGNEFGTASKSTRRGRRPRADRAASRTRVKPGHGPAADPAPPSQTRPDEPVRPWEPGDSLDDVAGIHPDTQGEVSGPGLQDRGAPDAAAGGPVSGGYGLWDAEAEAAQW